MKHIVTKIKQALTRTQVINNKQPMNYNQVCGSLILLKNDFRNAEIDCPLRHTIFQDHHPIITEVLHEYAKYVLTGVQQLNNPTVIKHVVQLEGATISQVLHAVKQTVLELWREIYEGQSLDDYPMKSRTVIYDALSVHFKSEMDRIIKHIENTILLTSDDVGLVFLTVAYMLQETYVTDTKRALYAINGPISELRIPIKLSGIVEYLTHKDCSDKDCKCKHCNTISNDYNSLITNLIEVLLDAHYREDYSSISELCHLKGIKKAIYLECEYHPKQGCTQSELYAQLRQTIREKLECTCSITELRTLWYNCVSHRETHESYCNKVPCT